LKQVAISGICSWFGFVLLWKEFGFMRAILTCGLLIWASALPADAAPYRGGWCLVANLGVGFVREDCSFRTFEACSRERLAFGSTAFCRVSGYTPRYWTDRPEPRRIKRPRKSQRR
jgi:hypothetical protein